MSAPKILFIGQIDYANLCNRIARALNTHAGERVARVCTEQEHPFSAKFRDNGGYVEDMVVAAGRLDDLNAAAQAADWVISTGDGNYELLTQALKDLPLRKDVKIGVTHAGTAYRTTPDFYNRLDRELYVPGAEPELQGARARFIGCDSVHLAKHLSKRDPRALPYFGTCEQIVPEILSAPRKPRVTHTPTTRYKKGTEIILPVLERLSASGCIDLDLIENVSPAEVARRRALAHIHVDQMHQDIGGFGQSAIEAMGMGCVVLADIRFVGRAAEDFVDKPPILDVHTGAELEEWIRLLAQERDVLERYRQLSLEWTRKYSAPEKVAAYWLESLERLG